MILWIGWFQQDAAIFNVSRVHQIKLAEAFPRTRLVSNECVARHIG
jgi:hypothetical protein